MLHSAIGKFLSTLISYIDQIYLGILHFILFSLSYILRILQSSHFDYISYRFSSQITMNCLHDYVFFSKTASYIFSAFS